MLKLRASRFALTQAQTKRDSKELPVARMSSSSTRNHLISKVNAILNLL